VTRNSPNTATALAVILTLGLYSGLAAPAFSQSQTTVQTKQYDTGGIYEGEFKDGKQHGSGKYTLPNG